VFAEPVGFDRDQLRRVLLEEWGIDAVRLSYQPVGFGTHHYRAQTVDGGIWFVNVDELAAKCALGGTGGEVVAGLERSLGTAAALHDAGLSFVHGPRRRTNGLTVAPMHDFAVSVFAFIDGTSYPYGEFPTDELRRRVLAALGRMHAATNAVPPALPRRDSLEVPNRSAFGVARRELDRAWSSGPYAEPARVLVRESIDRIDGLFACYDALVPIVLSTSDSWVVTHGEPHAANVMTTVDGELALIDWDTVALAPRERDLWRIEPRGEQDWAAYGVAIGAEPAAMELYRLAWELSEICGYTAEFHAPHMDNENTRVSWRSLQGYLTMDQSEHQMESG
jgi:spectinomycin phosphotransferase